MNPLYRLLAEIVGAALLLFGYTAWERHQGAQSCIRTDAKAAAKQIERNTGAVIAGTKTVAQEGIDYAHATTAPLAPTPTVRRPPRVQPAAVARGSGTGVSAACTGPSADAEGRVRAEDEAARLRDALDSTIRSDVQDGHNADAQIDGLTDYIVKVCPRPKD